MKISMACLSWGLYVPFTSELATASATNILMLYMQGFVLIAEVCSWPIFVVQAMPPDGAHA